MSCSCTQLTALDAVATWNVSRNLTTYSDLVELNNINKEISELLEAAMLNDTNARVDAYCDIIVFAAGAIHKLGYQPELSLQETVKEISSRRGSIDPSTGKWEKDRSQDPSTLYTANYDLSKY